VSQARRCELLTLTDARLTSYERCGRRGSPSIPDGTGYRVTCPPCRAVVERVRAAGLGGRLRWADREGVRP
jgi:hypothetical protein